MAQQLNVDRTLISKWKNGIRKIDVHSSYFEKLLDAILVFNTQVGLHSLEHFLSIRYELADTSPETIRQALKRFIVQNDFCEDILPASAVESTEFQASFRVYDGDEKKRKCILDFLDFCLLQTKPSRITFFYSEIFDSYMGNTMFRNTWIEKVTTLLTRDFPIDLIFSSARNSKFLLHFAKLLLHPHCKLYHYLYSNDKSGLISMHVLAHKMVVVGLFNSNKDSFCHYSAMYEDYISIRAYSSVIAQIKANSVLLLQAYTQSNLLTQRDSLQHLRHTKSAFFPQSTTYHCNPLPSILLMEKELAYEVIYQSFPNSQLAEKEFLRYETRRATLEEELTSSTVIHFYPLLRLQQYLKQPTITYGAEHMISQPALHVTNAQFKQHLQHISTFLQTHEYFHLCLTNSYIIPSLPSIYCWCKRNDMLCLFDNLSPSCVLISEDLTFINATADLLEQYYLYSSLELREKNAVQKLLEQLILV